MTLTDLIWLATGCYGLHILEEFQLNWRDWARSVIGMPVEWHDFYVVNGLVLLLGIVAAHVADTVPMVALALPALMLINAVGFHIVPVLRSRGRFSPGLITAVALFLPVVVACYWRAAADGNLGFGTLVGSAVIGALLMACPIVLIRIRTLTYFRQDL